MRRCLVPLALCLLAVTGCAHQQTADNTQLDPRKFTPFGHCLFEMYGCTEVQAAPVAVAAAATTPAAKPAPAVDISSKVTRVKATDTGFALLEKVQFGDGKSNILPASESLLSEVAIVLTENPDLKEVFIAGYTSSEGAADKNQKLSEQRAASVKTWLVAHGIDASRLLTGGFGSAHPVGDNATEAGREANRRVEFTATKYEVGGVIHENPAPTP